MDKLKNYEALWFVLAVFPAALLFPYPADLIPLTIQVISAIILFKCNYKNIK
jgi:hypothetical protein